MRTFIIILCIVAVAIVGVAVYLVVTTPTEARLLRFPLTTAQQELLRHVPADAEAYALVPAPVVLLGKLKANPITSEAATRWTEEHALPPAAMLGRADAVAWKSGKATEYAVRFDPVRAVIARAWTLFSPIEATWSGRTLIVAQPPSGAAGFSPPNELQLSTTLPEGDLFVVQRGESRGAFPPIGRPAVTSVRVTEKNIEMTSHAATNDGGGRKPAATNDVGGPGTNDISGLKPAAPLRLELPVGAMLAVSFNDPPRVLGDLERLIASDVDALVGDGGVIALYGVDARTLLPRPYGAIVVPANDASRAAAAKYGNVLGEVRESGGQLIIGLDRQSPEHYLKDAQVPVPWPANRWALRIDPARLIPVLRQVGDNPALRFAAPRVHRGARDLRRWMGVLEQASSIEAAASVTGGVEKLRVRVASK
ncbi:MAG TPA: hypothetical protein VND45_07170 [Thermoanaerobaculia bacterium]|jgi:hypothetical protein|nr:hypothetical protein [Thermoanaerobaculia bacterium]